MENGDRRRRHRRTQSPGRDDDRFFRVFPTRHSEGEWYYRAREGTFGPFPDRVEAEKHCELLCHRGQGSRDRYRDLWLKLKHF